jgi:hypothetical protein
MQEEKIFMVKLAFSLLTNSKYTFILILEYVSGSLNVRSGYIGIFVFEPLADLQCTEESIKFDFKENNDLKITDNDFKIAYSHNLMTFPVGRIGLHGPIGPAIVPIFGVYNHGSIDGCGDEFKAPRRDISNTNDREEQICLIFENLGIPDDYVEKFVEQKVWIELWPDLEDKDLDTLIDKIGDRIKFKK